MCAAMRARSGGGATFADRLLARRLPKKGSHCR